MANFQKIPVGSLKLIDIYDNQTLIDLLIIVHSLLSMKLNMLIWLRLAPWEFKVKIAPFSKNELLKNACPNFRIHNVESVLYMFKAY